MQYLELHIYDKRNTLILSDPMVLNWYLKDDINLETEKNKITNIPTEVKKLIIFDIHTYLRNKKINSGQYDLCLFIKEPIYEDDSYNDRFKISFIATNRSELIIETSDYDSYTLILKEFQSNFSKDQLILNCNNNDTFIINNWGLVSESSTSEYVTSINSVSKKYTIAIKLETLLPTKITNFSLISIEKLIYEKVWQDIAFIQKNSEYIVNVLMKPNFDVKINKNSKEETKYLNREDLISTNTEIKNLLENNYFSFYEKTAALNINFEDFSNFVFYSSIEHRLINFKYKISQIELLKTNKENVSIVSYQESYDNDIQEIILSFDPYEKFLYYDSSSYAWPKDSSGSLRPIDEINEWYSERIDAAILYDNSNVAILRNLVPSFILNDEYSSQFYIFIDLIAQNFDILWLYIKHLEYLHKKHEGISSGLSKDLIYHMLISYGWEPSQNNQFDDLWKYILGRQDETELESIDETDIVFTSEMIDKEIWKRILNNLPYLLKTKGTKEGIRALINCYGIPRTELAIREYGGPNKINIKSLNIIDKFAYAIKLTTDSNIIVPFYNPGSIEFRFKLTDKEDQVLFIREDAAISFNTINVDDTNGYLELEINAFTFTSDTIPIYNENWWSFLLREKSGSFGEYEIFLKSAIYNKINYEYSGSFDISGSIAYTEFTDTSLEYYIGFEGRMQEFRYWATSLNEEAFNNHVLSPTSYNGNTSIAPWEELIYRLPLGSNTVKYNHYETTFISSQHPQAGMSFYDCIIDGGESTSGSYDFIDGGDATSGSYDIIDGGDSDDIACGDIANARFENFANEYNYEIVIEQYAHEWPDVGGNRNISNKIRIEDNELLENLDLNISSKQSSYDLAPVDNAKIGIYFGPNLEVNQDIAEYMAGVNIDNYIGTSDDIFKNNYSKLKYLRDYYFKQYYTNYDVKDYFRLITYFNNSLFHHIEEITPARSIKITGLVIESHILDRSKVRTIKSNPSVDDLLYETEYNLSPSSNFTNNEYLSSETTLDLAVNSKLAGENIGYEAEILYNHSTATEYIRYNMYFDSNGNDQLIQNAYWYSEGVIDIIDEYVGNNKLQIENPLYRFISGASEFISSSVQGFKTTAFERLYFKGCKMISTNWNEPSHDMFDNSPIVEFWESEV